MTGGHSLNGAGVKDQPTDQAIAPPARSTPAQGNMTSQVSTGDKDARPRRYYVNKGELWTLRQRVSHGLNLIIVGMAVSLLANGFIFLTPMSLWSIYLAQIMNFLGTIVVFFGVLSIYFRLKD
jgi:hypothetical protein